MTASNLVRLGGPAAILGGVLFIPMFVLSSGAFFESLWGNYALRAPVMALLAAGVAGLYLYQSRRFGKLGKAGFYLSLAGFSAAAIGSLAIILIELVIGKDSTPIWLAVITPLLAAAMYVIGSMIFGIATYRARALPRGGALLLIAGSLMYPVGIPAVVIPGLLMSPVLIHAVVLFGGGWAWLGYAVFFSERIMLPAQPGPSGTRSAWEHEDRGGGLTGETVAARIVAVFLGVIPAVVLLASLFSDTPGLSSFTSFALYVLGRIGIVASLSAAFGVAFGLAIPRPSWRWGLWLNVPLLFLLAIILPIYLTSVASGIVDFGEAQAWVEALLLFGFFAGSLIAACLGAYAGARVRHHLSSE